MAQTIFQIRMDEELWEGMRKTCAMLKMSTDDAFSLFAEKMLGEGRLPFDVPEDPFFSEETRDTSGKASQGLSPGSAGSTRWPMADHRTALRSAEYMTRTGCEAQSGDQRGTPQ